MRKGQSAAITAVYLLPVLVVTILITFWVYGSVSNIVPHDQLYTNETICTSCTNGVVVSFDNTPVLNDSTLVCVNASGELMTRGAPAPSTCGGYNVNSALTGINLTNGSASCDYVNVRCTYTYNWANANEQGFWTTSTTNINTSYGLGSVMPIIFAAVIIISVVFLLGRK